MPPDYSKATCLYSLNVRGCWYYPEAAAALRITENALRVLVHRARHLLKTEMEALS